MRPVADYWMGTSAMLITRVFGWKLVYFKFYQLGDARMGVDLYALTPGQPCTFRVLD